MTNPLNPSPQLLSKLGSIVVHADELCSPHAHAVDRHALLSLFQDDEVNEWIFAMRQLAMIPVKRNY